MIVFVDPKNFHLELYSIFFCLCHDPEVPVRYTMAISFYEVSLPRYFVSTYMFLNYVVFLFFKFTFVAVEPKLKDLRKLICKYSPYTHVGIEVMWYLTVEPIAVWGLKEQKLEET